MKIYYNPKLKKLSRQLRKNTTYSEKILWKYLRKGQIKGYCFLRQKPIDEYIVDFYCKKLSLIIEIDGITYNDKQNYDEKRENRLKDLGFYLLRFDGKYVLENTMEALQLVISFIEEREKITSPIPPSKGELIFT